MAAQFEPTASSYFVRDIVSNNLASAGMLAARSSMGGDTVQGVPPSTHEQQPGARSAMAPHTLTPVPVPSAAGSHSSRESPAGDQGPRSSDGPPRLSRHNRTHSQSSPALHHDALALQSLSGKRKASEGGTFLLCWAWFWSEVPLLVMGHAVVFASHSRVGV